MASFDSGPGSLPRFAVTGAGGFVGSGIVRYLRGQGGMVYELRHHLAGQSASSAMVRSFSLQQFSPAVLDDVDVLIHAAYDFRAFGPDEIETANVAATIRLFEAARSANLRRIVFISSLSAFDGCKSLYGHAKMRVERRAAEFSAAIVRPGLVFGRRQGGMMAALEKLVSLPVFRPMVGDGSAPQYLVHEDDLSKLILAVATRPGPPIQRPVIAAHPRPLTLKQIMTILAAAHGKSPRFLPIPPGLIAFGLRCLESAGLRPRMRGDSLVSLLNPDPNPDFSLARSFGVDFRPFDAETRPTSGANP